MEVHAHSHTERKRWTHYLWEFLMLFFAVSLGFYAENIREGMVHREGIHKSINSVVSDLQSDQVLFDSILERNEYSTRIADSLNWYLINERDNTPAIYRCARAVTANFGYFYSNSKTFEQLKSSGLLKYIRSQDLLDSLGLYYTSFAWMDNQFDLLRLKLDAIHKGNASLFSFSVFDEMMKITYNSMDGHHVEIGYPAGHPALLSTDPEKINLVGMNYHYYSTTMHFYMRAAQRQRDLGKRLLQIIKQEY